MPLDYQQVLEKCYDSTNNALRTICGGFIQEKFTKTYSDFSTASTTNTITIKSLPAGGIIHAVKMKHSASFTGGAISAYTIACGITGSNTKYHTGRNVFQAPSEANKWIYTTVGMEDHLAATTINATATSTSANLNAATAGSVDIWILYSVAV